MVTNKKNTPQDKIHDLILRLDNNDGLKRQQARLELVRVGPNAVPELIDSLTHSHERVRWEAAKALVSLHDVRAAPALARGLMDEDVSVRWTNARALISLHRAGLPALLEALVQHFDSVWMRRGARHILHSLHRKGILREAEITLLKALQASNTGAEDVPWLAEKALVALPLEEKMNNQLNQAG